MKKLMILFLVLFLNFPLLARHLTGGYLSYSCNDNSNVSFVYNIYADACCDNCAWLDPFLPVSIFRCDSGDCDDIDQNVLIATLEVPLASEIILSENTNCVDLDFADCVKNGVYNFDFNFSDTNVPYLITYQRCCRSLTVTNLEDSGDQGMSIYTILYPEALNSCNSSPVLITDFQRSFCTAVEQTFSIGMEDTENDVISYELCASKLGGGSNLVVPEVFECDGVIPTPPCSTPYDDASYTLNHSYENPIGDGVLFSLDDNSGLITLTPDFIGRYAIAACITESRDEILLSETRLEFEIYTTALSTSVEDVVAGDLQIIPNPSKDEAILHLPKGQQWQTIHIINQAGQLIKELQTTNQDVINLPNNLANGLYFIKLQNGQGDIWCEKWMKH